jgi:hypothetical protein
MIFSRLIFVAVPLASLGVFAPASAAPLFYGTSLNALGQDLLIQADAATGQIISSRGLRAVDVWPFETEIAFPPAPANGAVPEPSSLAMLAIGLGAIAAFRRTPSSQSNARARGRGAGGEK